MIDTLQDGDQVLGKPFGAGDLAAAVRRALEHRFEAGQRSLP